MVPRQIKWKMMSHKGSMTITKIESVKGGRYRIYLNDEPSFCLYRAEIREYDLKEGGLLSEEVYMDICSAVLSKRAKLRCLHILEKCDKTEWQLRQKLREGEYPSEVIDEALAYVESFGYVNDLHYASVYLSDHASSRTARQMEADLKRRGIQSDVIREAFAKADPPDEKQQIRDWMRKKGIVSSETDDKTLRKFIAFLMRKGFGYGDIRSVLEEADLYQ